MAERRMFARAITGGARFLQMPATARLLYYDLGQEADDDGYCETYGVMRKTGASEDDLRLLVNKGFVRILNDDLVVHIVHWTINNHIRKDRYHPGIYKSLIGIPGDIIGEYDNQMTTEVSAGEDSPDKDRGAEFCVDTDISATAFTPPTVDEVSAYCAKRQNCIDPQRFLDYYTMTDWMVGRTKMQDWQAAIRIWERNDKQHNTRCTGTTSNPFLALAGGEYD